MVNTGKFDPKHSTNTDSGTGDTSDGASPSPKLPNLMIGDIEIHLPKDRSLFGIYQRHPTYDFVYWNVIGGILAENGIKDAELIDVGANIGDTIAHFRRFSQGTAYGVEAQQHFFRLLEKNMAPVANVKAFHALVCPDDKVGDVNLVGGGATGMTTLTPGAGTFKGKTISCAKLVDMTSGPYVFKTDTDGFDDSILADLITALDTGRTDPTIISFEGPTSAQMLDADYDGFIDVIRKICGKGYQLLILSNIGSMLGFPGTDAAQAEWHLRSLTQALRAKIGYCHYFDFIAVAPGLSCKTCDLTDMDSTIWTDIYRRD